MSNIHGLHSDRNDDNDSDDDNNNRYVGGVDSRGGGSGLAVEPNNDDVFGRAEQAGSDEAPPRRTITMYRNGFVVDDGPYRRLDDPNNAEFLQALASGHTPRELLERSDDSDLTVGLIDKRSEDYVERFSSFSGVGNSLGAASSAEATEGDVTIDPSQSQSSSTPAEADESRPTTSIQVRLLNGKRIVLKMNLDDSLTTLVARIKASGQAGDVPYQLSSGFPPKPLKIVSSETIESAGLKGAQVVQKKA